MAVADHPLARELAAFEAKRDELAGAHAGRCALVKGDEIVDTFETEMDAIKAGYAQFGLEPFLLKRIAAVDEPVTLTPFLFGL